MSTSQASDSPKPPRALAIACVLGLVGTALMVWSVMDPRPLPVILAMSLGQATGTLSLLLFAYVVYRAR
jgi:hypothetical protein